MERQRFPDAFLGRQLFVAPLKWLHGSIESLMSGSQYDKCDNITENMRSFIMQRSTASRSGSAARTPCH